MIIMTKFIFKINCRKFNPNGILDPLDKYTQIYKDYPIRYDILINYSFGFFMCVDHIIPRKRLLLICLQYAIAYKCYDYIERNF